MSTGPENPIEHSREAIEFALEQLDENQQKALYALASQVVLRTVSKSTPYPTHIPISLFGNSVVARKENETNYADLERKSFVRVDSQHGTIEFSNDVIYQVVLAKLSAVQKGKRATSI